MKQTSSSYQAYPDSRRVDVRISFRLLDKDASDNASLTHNGVESISNVETILQEEHHASVKKQTLEKNLWILDGSWSCTNGNIGYWSSALSGPDCMFSEPPKLTATLSAPASSIGFSLQFDDLAECWPTLIKITAYQGETLLAEKIFSNSGDFLAADMPVENYDKVVFEFLKTDKPYRRIKLYELLFGIVQQYSADNLVTATFKAGCAIDGESLPARELVFVIENQDKKYNFVNPKGIYKYLQDGQEIRPKVLIGGEEVDMGTHYFTKAEARDGALTAEITAHDPVYWLDNETYDGGTTGQWTLQEALAAVLDSQYEIDLPASLASKIVNRCIPVETSKREALRLLAQAACCSCWFDRNGKFTFRELSMTDIPVDTLTEDNMEAMDGIGTSEKIDRVELTVRNEFSKSDQTFISGTGKNTFSIQNPCAYNGQAVADWLLAVKQYRLQYDCINRGNPAVEIGDTITIYNAYDEPGNAVVYEYTMEFNGGLTETTKAIGATL